MIAIESMSKKLWNESKYVASVLASSRFSNDAFLSYSLLLEELTSTIFGPDGFETAYNCFFFFPFTGLLTGLGLAVFSSSGDIFKNMFEGIRLNRVLLICCFLRRNID